MNDAQTPRIRDPHAAVNLVGSGAAQPDSSSNVVDPLAALGPVSGSDASASTSGSLRDFRPLDMDDADGASDIDRALARLDPLTVRPRISSRVLCVVFGLLLIAIGFGVWWGCVFTENGQSYDELVWKNLHNDVPSWATGVMNAVAQSWLVIAVSCTIAAIGIITALIRRRWWLAGQIAVFAVVCLAVTRIKGLLPRPFIINTESPAANSAPSGHTMLAAACAVILLLTVPRAVRALAGVIGVVWAVTVGVSVIYGQWHRPSDVAMSILLVAGLALLALAVTRKSGMDEPGRRVSSVSVQIVGSVLITGGAAVARLQRLCDLAGGAGAQCQRQLGGSGGECQRCCGHCGCGHARIRTVAGPASDHCSALKPAGSDRRSAGTAQTVKHGVRTAEFARHNGGIWQLDMIHEYYDARNVVCFAQYIRSGYGYQTGDCGVSDQGPQDR